MKGVIMGSPCAPSIPESRRGRARTGSLVLACATVFVLAVSGWAQEEPDGSDDITGYTRFDVDHLGTQIWFGATHPVAGLNLASDVIMTGTTAELDAGPLVILGDRLTVSPMIGVVVDLAATDLTQVVPQFYVYFTAGKWYLESWNYASLATTAGGHPHTFTNRTFLLYAASEVLAVGPHAELTIALEDTDNPDGRLSRLALGGAASLSYGEDNTLTVFLGYQAREGARAGNDRIAGRVTFVRTW